MSVTIRDARETDLPRLLELERLCFPTPWQESALRMQMEQYIFLVAAEGDGPVLGYAGMMFVLDEGDVTNVAVAPEARRRHIADALLDELERRAAEKELAFLTLEVRESNAPAIALYEKHGFVPVGRRKNYYEKPREDAVLMTLKRNGGAEAEYGGGKERKRP